MKTIKDFINCLKLHSIISGYLQKTTMKRHFFFPFLLLVISGCSGQEKLSAKKFPDIALVNRIDFYNPKFDQPRFSCGFLLQYHSDTFAVTAKHLLKFIKPDGMATLSFENAVKNWIFYPLTKKEDSIVTEKLLNENKTALLADASIYEDDWLVFSIRQNHSTVQALQVRTTPLVTGEKLYVIGWTRKMETGEQRVYEFAYHTTIGKRILLKELIVPEQFGGLSGGPVVDEQGLVVGIVSGGTVDPADGKKYFSPCIITGVTEFLDSYKK